MPCAYVCMCVYLLLSNDDLWVEWLTGWLAGCCVVVVIVVERWLSLMLCTVMMMMMEILLHMKEKYNEEATTTTTTLLPLIALEVRVLYPSACSSEIYLDFFFIISCCYGSYEPAYPGPPKREIYNLNDKLQKTFKCKEKISIWRHQ